MDKSAVRSSKIAFIALASVTTFSYAQLPGNYPAKPIRLIVPAAPGGGIDVISRTLAQRLTERWGRPVVVDNRPGGGGVIALELAAQSPADGYTLYVGGGQITTATLQKKVPFDVQKVYVPIVQMTASPYLVIAPLSLPVSSVKDLIALAKSKPGTLNYGSAGTGTTTHLGIELFKFKSGVDIVHIPYKGNTAAFADLIAGQIQMMFSNPISSMPLARTGKLKALAVTGLQRLKEFPELPTVSETGVPGYDFGNWSGIYGPVGIPPAIVVALNHEVSRIINSPELKGKITADGSEATAPHSPAEFKAKFDKQIAEWDKFFKTSGVKL